MRRSGSTTLSKNVVCQCAGISPSHSTLESLYAEYGLNRRRVDLISVSMSSRLNVSVLSGCGCVRFVWLERARVAVESSLCLFSDSQLPPAGQPKVKATFSESAFHTGLRNPINVSPTSPRFAGAPGRLLRVKYARH